MAERLHRYHVRVRWSGNTGAGTASYRGYSRAHEIGGEGKPTIPGSSDPVFRGDAARWNPEEMLVASLSACHQLWYLHLCAEAGIVVTAYEDAAEGCMIETASGAGQFSEVVLHPHATLAARADAALAEHLHDAAHEFCFIARSVNFPVRCEPRFTIAGATVQE
jgi:organic hydroperoxide reductase OsmC/OhrA